MPILALFFIVLTLASCKPAKDNLQGNYTQSTSNNRYVQEKDGAPIEPQKITTINVKPIAEPLSHYGNPESYQVGNSHYKILRTATGYKTKGLASWYGTKFHKQRTSSGEKYDMYAMTAAHKTLPLPTYVRVKNLQNGKEAIVKVNDRGPFHADRIIDLSYAAASKLGILSKGTAPVEIEALLPPGAEPRTAHYYLQAGAFATKTNAENFKIKLSKITTSPVIIDTYHEHYVVKLGPFANKKMVDGLKRALNAKGVSGVFSLLQ